MWFWFPDLKSNVVESELEVNGVDGAPVPEKSEDVDEGSVSTDFGAHEEISFCFYFNSPFFLLLLDMEMEDESDGEATPVPVAASIENKVKKEHINVVFIGHVGMWLFVSVFFFPIDILFGLL